VLTSKGRGTETALVIVDALQRACKRGVVRIEGAWWDLLARLDVELPASKTARAALAILAKAGIVTHVSCQRWRLDTVALERVGRELQAPTVAPAVGEPTDEKRTPGADAKRTPDPSPDRPCSRRGAAGQGAPPLPRVRGRVGDLDPAARRRVPLWVADPHPLVSPLVATLERSGALGVGQATVVTLTVAPGADLDAAGHAFGERCGGLLGGALLVPETSPRGLRHYHGIVVGTRAEIIGAWQRCGGGIARAQRLDPLDPGDHEHLHRAVAYAMKRRHVEHGEVIATGVLASPWADDLDQRPADDDDLDQRPVVIP
jgi:hypothetical protein